MDQKVLINLDGFADFENQLNELARGYRHDLVARNTLTKAVKAALVPAYDSVQAMPIPYDSDNTSGIHLRDTLRIDARIPNAKDANSEAVMPTDAVIGILSVKKSAVSLANEFGTAKMAAQPFLRVGFERSSIQVLDALKSELSYLIPAYANKLRKKGIK